MLLSYSLALPLALSHYLSHYLSQVRAVYRIPASYCGTCFFATFKLGHSSDPGCAFINLLYFALSNFTFAPAWMSITAFATSSRPCAPSSSMTSTSLWQDSLVVSCVTEFSDGVSERPDIGQTPSGGVVTRNVVVLASAQFDVILAKHRY